MVHVGMHAAIGKKSEQVEAPAPTSCVLHGCEKHVVREELAILDHQRDTGAVHVDDTAGADIKMSHFTVPHLTVGQANIFFFSSRRRHTRLTCDWSSDVCSSD